MKYNYISNNGQLSSYLKTFEDKKNPLIALDTESELNLHAYGEKLCLIQIFDGINKVLVDPFKIDIDLIKSLFENRDILKVIYDSASDLSVMKNAYNIEVKSILDLRPAVALLNLEKQDLHSVIASEMAVFLENKERFQKNDWTKRPISREAIDYALSDVIYLLKLKDILLRKLYERQLMDTFILNNLKIQNKDYTRNPEDKYNRIHGYQHLREDQKLIARELSEIVEKYACLYNIPAHWVMKKDKITEIVKDPG